MAAEYDWLLDAHGPSGDAQALFELAQRLEAEGKVRLAASAYDRAFGLRPDSEPIAKARLALLGSLSVAEYGINFRYIPAGSFLMGSDVGEADEAPVHPVRLDAYWLSDTPISWAAYCDIMDWSAPPRGFPKQKKEVAETLRLTARIFSERREQDPSAILQRCYLARNTPTRDITGRTRRSSTTVAV